MALKNDIIYDGIILALHFTSVHFSSLDSTRHDSLDAACMQVIENNKENKKERKYTKLQRPGLEQNRTINNRSGIGLHCYT